MGSPEDDVVFRWGLLHRDLTGSNVSGPFTAFAPGCLRGVGGFCVETVYATDLRMRARNISTVAILLAAGVAGHVVSAAPPPKVTTRRLPQNPLITVRTSRSLGDNINGPSIVRVPDWIEHPLGRYYMYSRTTWCRRSPRLATGRHGGRRKPSKS